MSIYLYMQIYAGYMMYVYIYIHVVLKNTYKCSVYTIQYNDYNVHIANMLCIYMYIYICLMCVCIIYTNTANMLSCPRGLIYIYIPAMGWGSPEFPDQQRYNSTSRLFKGVNACSGW